MTAGKVRVISNGRGYFTGTAPKVNTQIIPLPTEVVVRVILAGILLKGRDPGPEAG